MKRLHYADWNEVRITLTVKDIADVLNVCDRLTSWGLWRCWCVKCLAKTADELYKKDAIEAWNRRADNGKAD